MISILVNKFIGKNSDPRDPKIRRKYGTLCGVCGVVLNVFLFIGKFIAGILSKSVSIQTDAFNNLSDAGSSLITLVGFKMAGKKPDPEHPFGHGRLEYLSGLAVSMLIILMGFELVQESIRKIVNPEPIEDRYFLMTLVILFVSVLIKLYMAFYNRKYGKKIDSSAMIATATDSFSDMISTIAVFLSTVITRFTGFLQLDGICGLVISVIIMYAGYKAASDTLSPLLGKNPDPEFIQEIEKIVIAHDGILAIHDLIVHDYGPGRRMISLHAEVPQDCNILEMHDLIDNIEHELKTKLSCDAVIHMDPIDSTTPETINLKAMLLDILHSVDARITMHDFRVVQGQTHTNLIFDVVLPYHFPMTESEFSEFLSEKVKAEKPNHNCVINIDHSFAEK